jgi:hypothetical protein
MTESESKKREDLVVTVGESGEGSGSDPLDFLERKPRGFFADQFEVGQTNDLSLLLLRWTTSLTRW